MKAHQFYDKMMVFKKFFLNTVREIARPPRGTGSSPLLLGMENLQSMDLSE